MLGSDTMAQRLNLIEIFVKKILQTLASIIEESENSVSSSRKSNEMSCYWFVRFKIGLDANTNRQLHPIENHKVWTGFIERNTCLNVWFMNSANELCSH